MSILSILSLVSLVLLNQVRTTAEGNGARLDARATHREVQARLRVILKAAIAPNEIVPPVVWPEIGNSDTLVRFHAPANLIDSSLAFDARTPDYPEFTLQFDAAQGALILQRTDATGPRQRIGKNLSSFEANRLEDRSLELTLTSQKQVRGASGSTKMVEERSVNRVLLHRQ